MLIQVVPHRPRDAITKKEVDGGQYQIRRDGKLVGYVGYHQGARPMFIERFSPLEIREMENEVRIQLMPQLIGRSAVVAKPPPFKAPREIENYDDDFDQGDFTR